MKVKKNFILREVPGMNVVMPTGENFSTFHGAVVLNDSALVIYKELEKGADRDSLIAALIKEYNVDDTSAGIDVDKTIKSLSEAGIIEE